MNTTPSPTVPGQQKSMILTELRVFELKQELDKRNLDKNGIKFALIERLETALINEGHDPKTYQFSVGDYSKSVTPTKTNATKKSTADESQSNAMENEEEENEDHPMTEELPEVKQNGSSEVDKDDNVEKKQEPMEGQSVEPKPSIVEKEDDEGITLEDDDMEDIEKEANGEADEHSAVEEAHPAEAVVLETKATEDVEKNRVEAKEEIAEDIQQENTAVTQEKSLEDKKEESTEKESLAAPAETVESAPPDSQATTQVSHHSHTTIKKSNDSLWIRGISPNTKAADLKALFSKYGRVVTAKIFTRRQQPSTTCFGFVTMVDSSTADLCIHKLHKTSLKGRIIIVERADRCNMPVVKIPKKLTGAQPEFSSQKTTFTSVSDDALNIGSVPAKEISDKSSDKDSGIEKEKKSASSAKVESSATGDKSKTTRAVSSARRTPVKAPSSGPRKPVSSSAFRRRPLSSRPPLAFRGGRRILERPDRFSNLRRPSRGGIRKIGYGAASISRRPLISTSRIGPASHHSVSRRLEVSSRRVEPPGWNKREMFEIMRKKEEEHRIKEQELRLQRERVRLKFERERIERERLELQQLRQMTAFAAPAVPPVMQSSRRSHEMYDDSDASRRRSEYVRSSGDRASHRSVSGSRVVPPDRRESRSSGGSSRHTSSSHHGSSRSSGVERDRSRHGREIFKGSESGYGSSHRESGGYSSREVGYGSSNVYGRDVLPTAYSRDPGGHSGSRTMGGGSAPWSTMGGSSSSGYVSSSRDYETGGSWIPSMSSQSHGISSGSSWPTRGGKLDSWSSGSGYSQNVSQYEKPYEKYDSYDKYSRRY